MRLTFQQSELLQKIGDCRDAEKLSDLIKQIPEIATPETEEYESLGKAAEARFSKLDIG